MARKENPHGLTDQQWAFVQEYLVSLNATDAYRRAGYKARGRAAEASASRLLRHARVAAAIQAEKAKRAARLQLKQDAVLEEIALMTHSTIEHYQVDDYGNLTLAPGAPANAMRAVSGLKKRIIHSEHGVSYEVEFKLWNKPASTRMAGEHLDIFHQQHALPDIHVHVGTARERVTHRLRTIAQRQEAQA